MKQEICLTNGAGNVGRPAVTLRVVDHPRTRVTRQR